MTDTRGHTLYKREDFTDLRGKFAFTADEYDIFEICFMTKQPQGVRGSQQRELSLSMKHGVEAKNYEEVNKIDLIFKFKFILLFFF